MPEEEEEAVAVVDRLQMTGLPHGVHEVRLELHLEERVVHVVLEVVEQKVLVYQQLNFSSGLQN